MELAQLRLARTRDANRNRNRFPAWLAPNLQLPQGQNCAPLARFLSLSSPHKTSWGWEHRILLLRGKDGKGSQGIHYGSRTPYEGFLDPFYRIDAND